MRSQSFGHCRLEGDQRIALGVQLTTWNAKATDHTANDAEVRAHHLRVGGKQACHVRRLIS